MSDDITKISSSDLDRHESDTDWDRLEEMTDEDIEEAVEEDEEQEFLTPEWFQAATLVDPSADKKRITIRLDEDVVDFFKQQGSGYQSRINKVLRSYVLTQKMRAFAEQQDEVLQMMSLLGKGTVSSIRESLDITRKSISSKIKDELTDADKENLLVSILSGLGEQGSEEKDEETEDEATKPKFP